MRLVALAVPISYNRWGDFDPHGALFVQADDVPALLAATGDTAAVAGFPELVGPLEKLRAAIVEQDAGSAVDAVSRLSAAIDHLLLEPTGAVRGRIQPVALAAPLVVRAHLGDCLAITLQNTLAESVSLEIPDLVRMGPPHLLAPGASGEFFFYVPDLPGIEGAHLMQSGADLRGQVRRGLFGMLVAEPQGARWLDPADPTHEADGPAAAAIIDMPAGRPDFREFVTVYHDEAQLWNSVTLKALPVIDDAGGYGPGTKAIGLRSEPFMDRLGYQDALQAAGSLEMAGDKSLTYSSYAFGDPAMFIPQSYVGEPTKFRLVNAGPGQPHVHHLHGGGVRWRATPLADGTRFDAGLVKDGSVDERSLSPRVDVVTLAPGQSGNAEPEGGAGGVQQSVGDLLFHCHIVEHYVAGMWSFWRVYNTRQEGLAELPDRQGVTPVAVDSTGLLGREMPDGTLLDPVNVMAWVRRYLPPRGESALGDASVWDWTVASTAEGPLALGEPEATQRWPNYESASPGERPILLFEPLTGRPAFPMLRPHLGERPPFAPGHGPAPYLTPVATSSTPDGVCPASARSLTYGLVATHVALPLNPFDLDLGGEVFVPAGSLRGVEEGRLAPKSVVLRANRGDCVDVTLTSRLDEKTESDFAKGIVRKSNIHIHLVQFDVQASDGVIVGANYEQSVRTVQGSARADTPLAPTTTLSAAVTVSADGQTRVRVLDLTPFFDASGAPKIGTRVGVGLASERLEQADLVDLDLPNSSLILDRAFDIPQPSGVSVGYEFVNYRWYADVELGVVYFHDHVDGLRSWLHGLYGSLIVEPFGSRWVDPKRVEPDITSSPDAPTLHVADIIDPGATGDASRTFREIVLQVFDRGCVGDGSLCTGAGAFPRTPTRTTEPAGFNTRSEPLWRRNASLPLMSGPTYRVDDPRTTVDERTRPQGDPSTDILEAFPGDPVIIRLVYTGQSTSAGVGTFGVTGHRFRSEIGNGDSRPLDTLSFGISAQHDLAIECGAGGCLRQSGDFLYFMTNAAMLDRGAWGIFRVHAPGDGGPLRELPGRENPSEGAAPGEPDRSYDVIATPASLLVDRLTGERRPVSIFAPASTPRPLADEDVRPLVLRVLAGETVRVNVTNLLSTPVTFHASMVSGSPRSLGLPIGRNADPRVLPGATKSFTIVADREVGAAHVMSLAQPVTDAASGLYGAIIVEPAGSSFASPTASSTTLTLPGGKVIHEQVLLYQDRDAQFETSTMPYAAALAQPALIGLRSAPAAGRTGPSEAGTCDADPNFCGDQHGGIRLRARNPLVAWGSLAGDPSTPVPIVPHGAALVMRVLGGAGDQVGGHQLTGHTWAVDWTMDDCREELRTCRSNLVSTALLGPREVVNAWIPSVGPVPGDYHFGSSRAAFVEAGAWGILRVT